MEKLNITVVYDAVRGDWEDPHGNSWAASIFTREMAQALSDTLVDCAYCYNSAYLKHCTSCIQCFKCTYLFSSEFCMDTHGSKGRSLAFKLGLFQNSRYQDPGYMMQDIMRRIIEESRKILLVPLDKKPADPTRVSEIPTQGPKCKCGADLIIGNITVCTNIDCDLDQ